MTHPELSLSNKHGVARDFDCDGSEINIPDIEGRKARTFAFNLPRIMEIPTDDSTYNILSAKSGSSFVLTFCAIEIM